MDYHFSDKPAGRKIRYLPFNNLSNSKAMNCKEYSELSVIEKTEFIGKAIHLLQNDSDSFIAASSMIRQAEQNGLFDNVTIVPERFDKEEIDPNHSSNNTTVHLHLA